MRYFLLLLIGVWSSNSFAVSPRKRCPDNFDIIVNGQTFNANHARRLSPDLLWKYGRYYRIFVESLVGQELFAFSGRPALALGTILDLNWRTHPQSVGHLKDSRVTKGRLLDILRETDERLLALDLEYAPTHRPGLNLEDSPERISELDAKYFSTWNAENFRFEAGLFEGLEELFEEENPDPQGIEAMIPKDFMKSVNENVFYRKDGRPGLTGEAVELNPTIVKGAYGSSLRSTLKALLEHAQSGGQPTPGDLIKYEIKGAPLRLPTTLGNLEFDRVEARIMEVRVTKRQFLVQLHFTQSAGNHYIMVTNDFECFFPSSLSDESCGYPYFKGYVGKEEEMWQLESSRKMKHFDLPIGLATKKIVFTHNDQIEIHFNDNRANRDFYDPKPLVINFAIRSLASKKSAPRR